jgi:hypothetical protein
VANDNRITDATSTASLEAAAPAQALGFGPALVGGGPFDPKMFAAT